MASRKPVTPAFTRDARNAVNGKPEPQVCALCGGQCLRGDFSSVANFGVTREPHFVTSYGWMQVKYDRATPVDVYMCLECGHVQFFGRNPRAVLDPLERQDLLRHEHPDLDARLKQEEKRRKELEGKGLPLDSDDHLGV
jgi:hypothetical protein